MLDPSHHSIAPLDTAAELHWRYNAICFSGMLSFEECLKVVRVRADAMHEDRDLGDACHALLSGW